jgi:hypothetical protein
VGSGKTQAAERAMRSFGMNPENDAPPILKLKAGSGEGLLKEIGDLAGAARLYSVDELGRFCIDRLSWHGFPETGTLYQFVGYPETGRARWVAVEQTSLLSAHHD